jgi:hypothetical protein
VGIFNLLFLSDGQAGAGDAELEDEDDAEDDHVEEEHHLKLTWCVNSSFVCCFLSTLVSFCASLLYPPKRGLIGPNVLWLSVVCRLLFKKQFVNGFRSRFAIHQIVCVVLAKYIFDNY